MIDLLQSITTSIHEIVLHLRGWAYTPHEHIIVKDDANVEIKATSIMVQNQGTTIVYLNEMVLLPGGVYKEDVLIPNVIDVRYMVRFGQDLFLAQPRTFIPGVPSITIPPDLWEGNRLYIRELRKKGRAKY